MKKVGESQSTVREGCRSCTAVQALVQEQKVMRNRRLKKQQVYSIIYR